MGWSYAVRAGWQIDAWTEACVANSGSQNVYSVDGQKYFWEASRRETSDGAITGTIWRFINENQVRKSGSFRVEGDGTITRAPKWLKDHSLNNEALNNKYQERFHRPTPEQRVANNHAAWEKAKAEGTIPV